MNKQYLMLNLESDTFKGMKADLMSSCSSFWKSSLLAVLLMALSA